MDADCSSKLACFSGECKNPCVKTKPCGLNAECLVVDTLPLRTMSCVCLPGFVGDADTACQPGIFLFKSLITHKISIILTMFLLQVYNNLYSNYLQVFCTYSPDNLNKTATFFIILFLFILNK